MIQEITRKKCSCCDGAGSFLCRSEQMWPNDGRDAPSAAPYVHRCRNCLGTGEEPTVDTLRSRMIGQSP